MSWLCRSMFRVILAGAFLLGGTANNTSSAYETSAVADFRFDNKTLAIGGLFYQFSLPDENGVVSKSAASKRTSAAMLAVRQVNNKTDGRWDHLLPNYQISFLPRDSKVDAQYAVRQATKLVQAGAVAIVGSATSGTAANVQRFLQRTSDVAQLSYSATSTALSDADRYRQFGRTCPQDGITADLLAYTVADVLGWKCVNVVVGVDDLFSSTGGAAFKSAAKGRGVDVVMVAKYISGSSDMRSAVSNMVAGGCLGTVTFAQNADLAALLLEADRQRFQTHWLTAEPQQSLAGLLGPRADAILDGVMGVALISDTRWRGFAQFRSDWFAQDSTATTVGAGGGATTSYCSDEVDASGYYIWREDGRATGRCLGIDFDLARQQRAQGECSEGDDPVCESASIWQYMPFVYDSVIAVASGLDQLVEREGLRLGEFSGPQLIEAIVRRPFEGASGNVTLLPNGDRKPDGLTYSLLNYHGTSANGTTSGWKHVGRFVDGANFVPCTQPSQHQHQHQQSPPCATMRFRGGQRAIPLVERPVARTLRIGGLFPFYNGDNGGAVDMAAAGEMMAAMMAVAAVNDNGNEDYGHLLRNHRLELLPRDTQINNKHAAMQAFDLVYKQAVGILGPAAFSTTASVQAVLQLPTVDVAQVTYAATNPELSDTSEFSLLARTPPLDTAEVEAQVVLMAGKAFNWTCVNMVINYDSTEAVLGSAAFTNALKQFPQLQPAAITSVRNGQTDMSVPISALSNGLCRVTAIFANVAEVAALLLEADRQRYPGVWFVGDEVMQLHAELARLIGPAAPRILNGMISTTISNGRGSDRWLDFERAWNSLHSTARIDSKGGVSHCSDTVDSTGYYVWRKDGLPDGECFGIDFEQASQKLRDGECTARDQVCKSARMSTYTTFAHDAIIAMATGLDWLLEHEGVELEDISGHMLLGAMINRSNRSSFPGVSGEVSFTPIGDRQDGDFEAVVYNYHGGVGVSSNTGFEAVGRVKNRLYTPCTELSGYGTSGPRDCGSKLPQYCYLVGYDYGKKQGDGRECDFADLVQVISSHEDGLPSWYIGRENANVLVCNGTKIAGMDTPCVLSDYYDCQRLCVKQDRCDFFAFETEQSGLRTNGFRMHRCFLKVALANKNCPKYTRWKVTSDQDFKFPYACDALVFPDGTTDVPSSHIMRCKPKEYKDVSTEECLECPAGSFCPDGINATQCPRGEYSSRGDDRCTMCPEGKYGNTVGLSKCADAGKCGKGEFTHQAATEFAKPECTKCPKGTYRKDLAPSSIAIETSSVCQAISVDFVFRVNADGTDEEPNPNFIVAATIVVLLALILPTYKLVQLIIRQARAHKSQSKHDAALANQFVLPKSTPEMENCIEALKPHERKLLRKGEWTERDVMDITRNCSQALGYLGRRVNEASDPQQVHIMECCLKMDVLYDFKTLYDATMNNIRFKEYGAFKRYVAVARKARASVATVTCPANPSSLVELYRSGRAVYDRFHDFVTRTAKASHTATVFKPHGKRAKMKGIYRVLEKSCFKYNYSWQGVGDLDVSQVHDVVRGGIVDSSMEGIADITDHILNSEEVTVCRVKDRFTKSSDSGWTDLMLNFFLNDDEDKHVCEVQLIHFKMLSQRTTQEGHGAYNIFRAASELLQHRNIIQRSSVQKQPHSRTHFRSHSQRAIQEGHDEYNASNAAAEVLQHGNLSPRTSGPQTLSTKNSKKNGRSSKVFPLDSDMPIKSIHDEPVPNDTENVRVLKVRDWLVGMHMGQYADNFVEAGFDDLDKVRQMSAKELGQVLTGSTAMTNHQCGVLTKCIGQL